MHCTQHSTSLFQTRRIIPEPAPLEEDRPSRSGSRATLASLSSFPFHPITSPGSCSGSIENSGISNNPQILDSLDPSFLSQLNNLQANQIDDLENVLLPHLHSSAENPARSEHRENNVINENNATQGCVFTRYIVRYLFSSIDFSRYRFLPQTNSFERINSNIGTRSKRETLQGMRSSLLHLAVESHDLS
jgi:hypothetical protein